ncbi:monosaccharide ABC transporter ATP-binding protein (CUT2 family) [Microcella alkaliphila]|uniref:Monosaccharide ABC transporter ATP-binding protein (CUT2 family) n=1 Tax=Microcella alkaliphila TaxID=279828 RepID=A0A4Q7TJ30_9MICO|nr:ATP-binding cassette domain-containing protein [Microcella alkaliphila]RZT60645.1 monosaccharide ABC transporter ATP-binding protein (CUT2 family) [Microcella alkaliphila]
MEKLLEADITEADDPGLESTAQPVIETRGITKSFGHVEALRGASLRAYPGEVLALIGDNGAGKSTLANVIAGVHASDGGELLLRGNSVDVASVRQARELGIEIVYQDLAQAPDLTVSQNFFFGRELLVRGFGRILGKLDEQSMRQRTKEAMTLLGAQVPSLTVPVSALSGGQRQAIAVARAVMWAKAAIIMDEPTAALGTKQTAMVYDAVRAAADRGLAVILVSHDIPKMIEFADRMAIMRHGAVVSQMPTDGLELVDVLTTMLTAQKDEA